jgi:hypothetical protein
MSRWLTLDAFLYGDELVVRYAFGYYNQWCLRLILLVYPIKQCWVLWFLGLVTGVSGILIETHGLS